MAKNIWNVCFTQRYYLFYVDRQTAWLKAFKRYKKDLGVYIDLLQTIKLSGGGILKATESTCQDLSKEQNDFVTIQEETRNL